MLDIARGFEKFVVFKQSADSVEDLGLVFGNHAVHLLEEARQKYFISVGEALGLRKMSAPAPDPIRRVEITEYSGLNSFKEENEAKLKAYFKARKKKAQETSVSNFEDEEIW